MFFVKNPEAYEQRSKRIGVSELKDLSQLHKIGTLARVESINRLQSGDGTPFASILVTSVARIRLTGELPTAEDAPVAEAMVELFKVGTAILRLALWSAREGGREPHTHDVEEDSCGNLTYARALMTVTHVDS